VNISDQRLHLAVPTEPLDGEYCDAAQPGCVRVGVEDGEARVSLEPWETVALDRSTGPEPRPTA